MIEAIYKKMLEIMSDRDCFKLTAGLAYDTKRVLFNETAPPTTQTYRDDDGVDISPCVNSQTKTYASNFIDLKSTLVRMTYDIETKIRLNADSSVVGSEWQFNQYHFLNINAFKTLSQHSDVV